MSPALLLAVLLSAEAPDAPRQAEIDGLRAEMASEIQLQATNLLDELVFQWTKAPPFGAETPVVMADLTVPVGLGTGLEALLETHLAQLLLKNPSSRARLTHCPECSAWVVRSGSKGTIVSRGHEAPEVLSQAATASGTRHALFLDFEAEGTALVLRARLVKLEADLPVVYANTISSETTGPALLRSPDRLTSAEDARKEYVEALEGRGVVAIPLRIAVRSYQKASGANVNAPPFPWVMGGVEVAMTQTRAWTASFSVGYTWFPEMHDGWMAEARIARVISGRGRSLTLPDLSFFVGASLTSIQGSDANLFTGPGTDTAAVTAAALGSNKQRANFGAVNVGLELRVKNRIGFSAYLETAPMLYDAPNLGSYADILFLKFQGVGMEVVFCF